MVSTSTSPTARHGPWTVATGGWTVCIQNLTFTLPLPQPYPYPNPPLHLILPLMYGGAFGDVMGSVWEWCEEDVRTLTLTLTLARTLAPIPNPHPNPYSEP